MLTENDPVGGMFEILDGCASVGTERKTHRWSVLKHAFCFAIAERMESGGARCWASSLKKKRSR